MKRVEMVCGAVKRWCTWIAVTGVSLFLGLILANFIIDALSFVIPGKLQWLANGVLVGTWVALIQWAYLQPKVKGLGWWVMATITGWLAGLALTTLILGSSFWSRLGGGILGGLVIGFAQWLVLDLEDLRKHEWLLSTTFGWSLAVVVDLTMPSYPTSLLSDEILLVAISSATSMVLLSAVAISILVFILPEQLERRI